MLNIEYRDGFLKSVEKVRDGLMREKIKKQVRKILETPDVGKPMMHERKGTREVYVSPYRLSYAYIVETETVMFLDLYHKDEQ